MPSASQKSAISSMGSTAPVFVVPAFPQTAMGANPAARSSATMRLSVSMSMRKNGSLGTFRTCAGRTPTIVAARLSAVWL